VEPDVVGHLLPAAAARGGNTEAGGRSADAGGADLADRVAQTAAVLVLGPRTEPGFHPDSFGYRPGRSALDAVAVARKRSWKHPWVIDLDIRGYFDSNKLLAAVDTYLDWETRWVGLYVERWLKAPLVGHDGTPAERVSGCGQGGPLSPLLANIFGHFVFDRWMAGNYPAIPFERYSDDGVPRTLMEVPV